MILRHPQPVGIHALPTGLLLIDDKADGGAAREALLAGLDVTVPLGEDDSPITAYNDFVRDPAGVDGDELRRRLPQSVADLVDVVRYAVGETATPPAGSAAAAPEVAAVVRATQASHALEHGSVGEAVNLLRQAVDLAEPVSPVLGAVLRATAASAEYGAGNYSPQHLTAELGRAAEVLRTTDLNPPRAEVELILGQLAHETTANTGEPMRRAMQHYYAALRLVDPQSEPLLWARAQIALATTQLASPMSQAGDMLRYAVATQSLRAALNVLSPADHPAEWASATVNLANALVYAPSVHQGDNLVEAVELYEQVLATRDRERDPVGRARVLTNMGNALAHLGIFDHAAAKLVEARYLFEEAQQSEAVMTVRSLLDEIAKAATLAGSSAPEDEWVNEELRQVAQLNRMPVSTGPTTSGMGVRIGFDAVAPKPTVTVLTPPKDA